MNAPRAIIVFGPPGSGKGTLARFLASKFGLIQYDTGSEIEKKIKKAHESKNRAVLGEEKVFAEGGLLPAPVVTKMVLGDLKRIARYGDGVVLSGSPRRFEEARVLIPFLTRTFGRENLVFIELKVNPQVSIARNSKRLICSVCGASPIGFSPRNRTCPICLGRLEKRELDKPAVIKVRLKEYLETTEPIFSAYRREGYKFITLDTTPPPYKIFASALKKIKSL
ncbi:MAG: nucleoside monophosphate kinase [Patescibacteria group bacterium]|nr:nucleoside monophosphate kinase [Patescibacteria group bacterium]